MKRQRGISLMEALVALAVMGFGMLGVVGLQATLRYNGDVSKQRSEAVRIAQERIENRRSFSVFAVTPGRDAFDDIIDRAAAVVVGTASNTEFRITEDATVLGGGRTRALVVTVEWTDRTNVNQSVTLGTNITRMLPELAASLSIPAFGLPSRLPDGRHGGIPRGAIDQGDGTSKFTPPGAGAVSWVFNNTTGFITDTCDGLVCTPFNARLLAGFAQFSTDPVQPTGAQAELPSSPAIALNVNVKRTFPAVDVVSCFEEAFPQWVAYFCAVPVDAAQGNKWSGRSVLDIPLLAADLVDPDAGKFRVCRYTPVRNAHPVVPAISNEEHPLDYADVSTALVQQNFLVIRAGDGVAPFSCPPDDAATPFVNGNTWHHQPDA